MILSQSFLEILVQIALVITSLFVPVILFLFIKDWKGGKIW